ncbi:glycosyltransferase family 4 protein [bacterium]|nr:glycosyltransferase family 4 protein [bacterium]
MSVLIVSSYPPMACGIGKYAEQQAEWFRRRGERVDVFSPPDGGGDMRGPFDDGLLPLRLLRPGWAYRQIWIHFTPNFYYRSGSAWLRWMTSLAFTMLMALLGRRVNFLIHETEYKVNEAARPGLRARLDRWWWRWAGRVVFHSSAERDAFARYYRLSPVRKQFEVWPHEKFMVARCELDRGAARSRLGLDPAALLLVSVGFIQPHKGFDRVIEAMRAIPDAPLQYKIVGSVRTDWDVAHQYAGRLHELADSDPRCEVNETYLSDELFDMWMVAADYVVIPYREIWSSGVAARARLLGRPAIAANTGGMAEQLIGGSLLFDTDEQLVEALRRVAAAPAAARRTE